MSQQIPSLQSLRMFEVLARYGNCTHAAQELCLTPSAVSKQLQSLEDTLGVVLFIRGQQGLTLNSAGQLYLSYIKPVMAKLAEAGERVVEHHTHSQDLHLRCLPSLADRWLLPRISDYTDAHPDHRIHIDPSALRDENLQITYDLYIRFGRRPWPGFVANYLCGRQLIIVASPAMLQRQGEVRTPEDLLRFSLFEHSWLARGWPQVFQDLGLSLGRAPSIVRWDYYSVIIRSACLGHGLSMVPKCFVTEELARGDLVQLLGYSQTYDSGYHLLVPMERMEDPSIARFRKWLLSRRGEGED
jgi:DNA-binding transcriptional LysR family regulator